VDVSIINFEDVLITAGAVGGILFLLLRLLRRSRPELAIGRPMSVGYVLRLVVILGLSVTGLGSTIRGGDEVTFITQAHHVASLPWSSGQWLPTAHSSYLHILMFAAQIKLLGSPEGALRITQVGIALTGVLLIATAVYDISGPRAARLTAWLLCLEPASLLFNELLHKEPNMELATGLVVFGGVKVWQRLSPKGMVIMALGGLIALGTRHYIGWFLFACALMIILHAALRRAASVRSIPLIYGVAGVIVLATPAVLAATSHQSLVQNLQVPQNANATNTAGNGQANGNNLALEKVDLSSRSAIATHLPLRIRDVLLRPYPWQVGDFSQQVGVVGSLIALACFFLMIRYGWQCRGRIFERAGPLLWPFLFLMIGYALAVGNAGTGFRYRTHLVTLAFGTMVILRETALAKRRQESGEDMGAADRSLPALTGRPPGHGIAVA
jgi:hypothetical protein